MKNTAFPIALFAGLLFWVACAKSPTPVQIKTEQFTARQCVNDSLCAEMRLSYPVVSGADSAVVRRLNDSIQVVVYLAANADQNLPFRAALDTAAVRFFEMLQADYDANPDFSMSYSMELDSRVAMQSNRYLSIEMNGYAFTGGAHGYYYTVLNTFHIETAESVRLEELFPDTAALRPLLEKAFLEVHRKEQPEVELADLLLEPDAPLALPANYCVVPEGVRFVYNPYEVAAYAVGQADFTLTWKQLGTLVERKKWAP
ncbi:MAG: DUF3298 and DUF4163 domain-containing protein [Lewinellaceae bacterium]|nr:DUF3298 and DUF4163 domain-containing protein [Lewinellaceae bacterium]